MQDYFIERRGIYLAIHNNSQNVMTKYDGIKIPVGFATDVGFRRTYYSKKEYPYSTCVNQANTQKFTSVYYDLTLQVSKNGGTSEEFYSKKQCYELCMQFEYIYKRCSCTDASIARVSISTDITHNICRNLTQLECISQVRDEFDSSTEFIEKCSPKCPDQCSYFTYTTSVSMADYPTTYYYNALKKQPDVERRIKGGNKTATFELLKYSCLLVNVFYEDLLYTAIEEEAALTLDNVIGQIGLKQKN